MKPAAILSFTLFCTAFVGASAATLTVDSGGDSGGTCPGSPCTLRQAIISASPGDTINFSPGLTSIEIVVNELTIDKHLIIAGPGAQLLTVARKSAARFRIFNIVAGNFDVVISGLTISNGLILDSTGGGAIRNSSSGNVSLEGCVISGNTAGLGGGIYKNTGGGMSISGCVFSANVAANSGGGAIHRTDGGTVVITDTIFSGNSSQSAGGGAILNTVSSGSSVLNLTNCTVHGNTAAFEGAGISNQNNSNDVLSVLTLNIEKSTISANSLNGFNSAGGAGISNRGAGNSGALVNIVGSAVHGNSSSLDSGGGISNRGFVRLTNCTIGENSAPNASAIRNSNFGTINISNCTITRNASVSSGSPSNGSSVRNESGMIQIKSSIAAGNTSNGGSDVSGSFASSGFNLIGKVDGSTGFSQPTDLTGTIQVPLDPGLSQSGFQNNGDATKTIALRPGSPAIDQGTSVGLTGALASDQRGFARTLDYPAISNASGGDGTDIGAFELALPSAVSRKAHSAQSFDVNLPLTGSLGVECRSGGQDGQHQVIVTFPYPVAAVGSVAVSGGVGAVEKFSFAGDAVTVDLTGIANAQLLAINFSAVSDGSGSTDLSVPFAVLAGDINGNKTVSASDVALAKTVAGQAVDATNFRADVNVGGSISASDIALVKSASGTTVP